MKRITPQEQQPIIDTVEQRQGETAVGALALSAAEGSEILEQEALKHPDGYERQYTGICDVTNPEDVRSMLRELKESKVDSERRLMVGIMTHPAVLNPNADIPDVVREAIISEFPSLDDLSSGFIDDPDVMNTIHYADLYGPSGPRKSGEAPDVLENLELCVEHGGENLDAIQLDIVWPNPEDLKEFRARHPDIEIILQIGKFSLGEGDIDVDQVVEKLGEYGKSVDHVLIDLSMGKGRQMTNNEVTELKRLMRAIQDTSPDIGLAIAGGLGAASGSNDPNSSVYSMDSLKEIARHFPGISIDAQGGLKPDDAQRDDHGHFVATTMADPEKSVNYISLASEILDGPLQLHQEDDTNI